MIENVLEIIHSESWVRIDVYFKWGHFMLKTGILYIVATPIGNLADLTPRAVTIMQQVDLLAVEDTRHTQILLQQFSIKTPCLAVHEHNEAVQVPRLIERLSSGASIALVSDAGTPLISDPGFQLVRAAHQHHIQVVPIPGASAVLCALSAAGLPTDRFIFEGFLPAKSAARQRQLQLFQYETRTVVFFESGHRVLESIADFCTVLGGERLVVLARELTKCFETIRQSTLAQLYAELQQDLDQHKGEMVIVLAGAAPAQVSPEQQEAQRVLPILLQAGLSGSQAVTVAAQLTGCRKKILYDLMLNLRYNADGVG